MMRKAMTLLIFLILVLSLALQVGCSKDEDPVTPPPACSIAMTTPTGGESWFTGKQVNIRWTQTTGGNVKIELYKGANATGVITPTTPNNGFYPWLSSATFGQDSGEDYSIKVSHLTTADCSAQTNNFELIDVSNCYIKFPWTGTGRDTVPTLTAGQEFLIEWDSDNTSGFLDIELWYEPFAQEGELVGYIAQDLANTGSYLWTSDTFNRGTSEGYRFKIRDVDAPNCTDTSIRFEIIDEDNCSINVWGVNEGQMYQPGNTINLTFNVENSSGIVKMKLYSGNIPVTGGMITLVPFDTENGSATYPWVVTDFGHTGPANTRYNIRAWDVDDEYCVGQSSDFGIAR